MNIQRLLTLLGISLITTSFSVFAQTASNRPDTSEHSAPEIRGQLNNRTRTQLLPPIQPQQGLESRRFMPNQFNSQQAQRFAPWMQGRDEPRTLNQFRPQGQSWSHGSSQQRRFSQGTTERMRRSDSSFDASLLDRVKSRLNLTTAQESAWSKYTKTVQDNLATIKKLRESIDPEAVRKMNSAERFAFITKQRQQIQKPLDSIQAATDELTKILDDSQKFRAQRMLPSIENFISQENSARNSQRGRGDRGNYRR